MGSKDKRPKNTGAWLDS